MITGPNNPNLSAAKNTANNAVSKYTAESKAGQASASQTAAAVSSAPAENNAAAATAASDVSLSKEARMMQKLSQEISSYPSVDAERVAEIKREIASGGFNVNTGSIAQKMMLLDSLY